MENFLNLGCGTRICADPRWVHVDFASAHSKVIRHNLLEGIPFPDGSFAAVYSSHVLEHFLREDGKRLVRECFRVARSGGVVRIAVPDLEQICRLYLTALEGARGGDDAWRDRYDWMMLELLDQSVRTRPGGEMLEYLRREELDEGFILSRIGGTGREILAACREESRKGSRGGERPRGGLRRLRVLRRNLLLDRKERKAVDLGLFRLGGEVHQWMYDEWSLGKLLRDAGFLEVRRCSATESGIPGWVGFGLDIDPDGMEHAPNSLYLEGTRP
jgi:predicted SAM-dependent methyltransferase